MDLLRINFQHLQEDIRALKRKIEALEAEARRNQERARWNPVPAPLGPKPAPVRVPKGIRQASIPKGAVMDAPIPRAISN